MKLLYSFLIRRRLPFRKSYFFFSDLNSILQEKNDPIPVHKLEISDLKSQIYKIPNLKELISFSELQKIDFNADWHHSLNVDFFRKLNEMLRQETEFNEKAVQFFQNLLEKIDEKMTNLLNPRENNDNLINELLDLEKTFQRKIKIPFKKNCFLNPIFVKSILKSKNPDMTFRLILLFCDHNAIEKFVDIFPFFTVAEMLFLSWKLSTLPVGERKQFILLFEEAKKEIFSLKRFKEISTFSAMRMYMVAIRRYENKFLFENKEIVLEWFFKLMENENWPLHESHIVYILDVLKSILIKLRVETFEKLQEIKVNQALRSEEGMICFAKVTNYLAFNNKYPFFPYFLWLDIIYQKFI
jgi:hypothetical protein